MVLGRLGAEQPAFSQGALQEFRERLIGADLDRRVLERTVELAKRTKAFDHRKLPKTLRVAIDSSPLEGAGRVEDTYNLLAHAARNVVGCAARLLGWPDEKVCRAAGIPLLVGSSVKAALDIDWNDAREKAEAIQTFSRQLDALQAGLETRLPEEIAMPPLKAQLETLAQIRTQDLEPDPVGGVRIRQGVAEDRRVSIADTEMRHGRKSKSKRFNGFKRHIAADVDHGLVLACAITPANRPAPRDQCTTAQRGHGRSVAIAENEQLQHRLRKQIQTPAGRAALRERTIIEHKLAHISQRQGNHARYVGIRKNTFDLRRASA